MGHRDSPIRHHDHQIPQAQLEARVSLGVAVLLGQTVLIARIPNPIDPY
jgi:hypothetical protein